MRDIPIIFSAPMIRALLDGRKTMTRRLLYTERKIKNGIVPKAAAVIVATRIDGSKFAYNPPVGRIDTIFVPSGWQNVEVGDRLWVRENFWALGRWEMTGQPMNPRYSFLRQGGDTGIFYAADDPTIVGPRGKFAQSEWAWHLRPNIFLPRTESRLTLVVTAKKIERLKKITNADCIAEGPEILDLPGGSPDNQPMTWIVPGETWHSQTVRLWYHRLWDSLHGEGSWDSNPEVVALSFTVHAKNIDSMKEAA